MGKKYGPEFFQDQYYKEHPEVAKKVKSGAQCPFGNTGISGLTSRFRNIEGPGKALKNNKELNRKLFK